MNKGGFNMVEKTKVAYDLDKKLKAKLTIVALNKEISQTKLLEEYIADGLKKDEKFLTSHLD